MGLKIDNKSSAFLKHKSSNREKLRERSQSRTIYLICQHSSYFHVMNGKSAGQNYQVRGFEIIQNFTLSSSAESSSAKTVLINEFQPPTLF